MTDAFQVIREALRAGNIESLRVEKFQVPAEERLVRALTTMGRTAVVGRADIAGLVHHLLARESAQGGGAALTLDVPHDEAWPSREEWERCGLDVAEMPDYRVLRLRTWRPTWLPGADLVSPGGSSFAEQLRRNYTAVRGDPFLGVIGRSSYRCVGQREAIRAVVSMPAGATLVVNLPTGAGKSLCAQLPALLDAGQGELTVVVVPTTALAIDQESTIRQWVRHPTAFYATGDEGSRRRAEVLRRLFDGTQRIVFTSPEGLLGALRKGVYAAARQGLLRYLVIDEAHMVEQWGDEFRSSFQELAGLRSDLTRSCPHGTTFRTLLLTATLTQECIATLGTLFGASAERFAVISAVQLRPEPEYWVTRAESDAHREEMVLEAVHRLPRSLILYVTQPRHAEQWKERLRALGYLRCESVTGQTPAAERERVIHKWREYETDIVVATSAFGLGMDQGDVRSVIHACVPENVDRFYQEVGRSGRDGRASVSLLVYTSADLDAAQRLNRSTIIGIARGRQRWLRMFGDSRKAYLGEGRVRVPIDVVPSNLPTDIDMANEYNVAWNIRTLTLMQRAGLIALDSEPPTADDARASDKTSDPLASLWPATRVVRILDQHHRDQDLWDARVKPIRHAAYARDRRTHELMLAVLDGSRCMAAILEDAYTILEPSADGARTHRVRVSRSCGGCPNCRAERRRPYAGVMPIPAAVWPTTSQVRPALASLIKRRAIAVFYRPAAARVLRRLVVWFIFEGCRTLVCPDDDFALWESLLRNEMPAPMLPFMIGLSEYEMSLAPRVPTLVLMTPQEALAPRSNISAIIEGQFAWETPPQVLLLPEDVRSVERPDRLLRETIRMKRYSADEIRVLGDL